jgi:hypothetical protein
MVAGGEQEVDASQKVSVPVNASTQSLTILVVNGSVENTPAQVTVSQGSDVLEIKSDLSTGEGRPIYLYGCPTRSYVLVATSQKPFPPSYTMTWSLGDGSPDVTVANSFTVQHAWPGVGLFPVTATLRATATGPVLAQGTGTAKIAYFRDEFRLSSFQGSSSGTFTSAGERELAATMTLASSNPAWTNLHWKRKDTDPAYLLLLLDYCPPGGECRTVTFVYPPDPAFPKTADNCVELVETQGNTFTARQGNALTWMENGPRMAELCMSLQATQTGDLITGTASYFMKHYNWNPNPVLATEASGSYTFIGRSVH